MTSNNKPSQPCALNLSRRRFVQGSSALVMSAPLLAIPAWAQGGGSASSPSRQAPRRLANNPLGFNGARQDPATGLYHLGQGYRVYNPALMRFQACDSMSPFGKGGINAYAYCLGDPVNLRDPSGHFAIASLLISAAVGAAVGAATSAIGEGIRSKITETEFEWKQVAFGALLGGISGIFGGAGVGAKASAKFGLAVGDTVVSGFVNFGLNQVTRDSMTHPEDQLKQSLISAGIGAAVGLVSFGAGYGAQYLRGRRKRNAGGIVAASPSPLAAPSPLNVPEAPPPPPPLPVPPPKPLRADAPAAHIAPPRAPRVAKQKTHAITHVREILGGYVTFEDTYKGATRLNISTSGQSPNPVTFVLNFNKSGGSFDFPYIRVLANDSGGGENSLAEYLSNLPGVKGRVKGFEGAVSFNINGGVCQVDKSAHYSPRKFNYT